MTDKKDFIKGILQPIAHLLPKESAEHAKTLPSSDGDEVLALFAKMFPYDTLFSISMIRHLRRFKGVDTSEIEKAYATHLKKSFYRVRNTISESNALALLHEERNANCSELSLVAQQMLSQKNITSYSTAFMQRFPDGLDYDINKQHVFTVYNNSQKNLGYILSNPSDPDNIVVDLWLRRTGQLQEMIELYKETFSFNPEKEVAYVFDQKVAYTATAENLKTLLRSTPHLRFGALQSNANNFFRPNLSLRAKFAPLDKTI